MNNYFKQKRLIDKEYLQSAKDKCCCICGSRHGVVMHHIRLGLGGGVGIKPSDDRCLPLCSYLSPEKRGCHTKIHENEKDFLKRYEWVVGKDPIAFAKLLYKRYLTNSK